MTDILAACADLDEVTFATGDVMLPEGDPGEALYLLIDGEVAIAKRGVHLLTISEPGAVFGEMAALLGGTYSATVSAASPVRAKFSPDGPALLAARPELTLHAAQVLAQRLHAATAYLADLKVQFEDRRDHFGMMDTILEALLQKQGNPIDPALRQAGDPRL